MENKKSMRKELVWEALGAYVIQPQWNINIHIFIVNSEGRKNTNVLALITSLVGQWSAQAAVGLNATNLRQRL